MNLTLAYCLMSISLAGLFGASAMAAPVDRQALVARHAVEIDRVDPLGSLTVGNGEFAFTVDATGLQSFPELYERGVPLGTQSQWGWHSEPNPERFRLEDTYNSFDVAGRRLAFPEESHGDKAGPAAERAKRAAEWLRRNPHRLDLAKLGLFYAGKPLTPELVTKVRQRLDLWRGQIDSRYDLDGTPVEVQTLVHPDRDVVAVRIKSPLVANARLGLRLRFPNASAHWRFAWTWERPEGHSTEMTRSSDRVRFARRLNDTSYLAEARVGDAKITAAGPHDYTILRHGSEVIEIVLALSPEPTEAPPSFASTRDASANWWRSFWSRGLAIDLSESADPRARELERRIVLSQYLTATQSAGSQPPQETGLTTNSWFGKFHLEMHPWHAAQFALWGRPDLLNRSMGWYARTLAGARAAAERQGYKGARWPKMVGPEGHESPSDIGVFLIWQQPHPILLSELLYRAKPTRRELDRHKEIVFASADFLASYPVENKATGELDLTGALIPAQETYRAQRTSLRNPTFELAYWRWGLETAQRWRERLGLERRADWQAVLERLAVPTVRNGAYAAIATPPYTIREDHPSMLGALGLLPPTHGIDPVTMGRTLDQVKADWNWSNVWGWDFPLMAMTAARLGRSDAVDLLLMDTEKNRYLTNGHNFQAAPLPLYLPGNGGLLYAVALMACGWDASSGAAPGFPKDGRWIVRVENCTKVP